VLRLNVGVPDHLLPARDFRSKEGLYTVAALRQVLLNAGYLIFNNVAN